MENDGEAAKRIVEEMLDSAETICDFQKAPLYAYMKFREIEGEFYGVAAIAGNQAKAYR